MRSFILGLLALTVLACDKTYITVPTTPSTTPAKTTPAPTPTPGPTLNTIQFRVLGNAISARVRYATPTDGLAQVITTLPYFNGFSTTATSIFLSLDVTPTAYPSLTLYPFLAAQIVVNDTVFREATAQDASLATLSVNGTWRQ